MQYKFSFIKLKDAKREKLLTNYSFQIIKLNPQIIDIINYVFQTVAETHLR